MSYNVQDEIDDSRRDVMGISSEDFGKWAIKEKYITRLEALEHPEKLAEILDERWDEYIDDVETAYYATLEDQKFKWGEK